MSGWDTLYGVCYFGVGSCALLKVYKSEERHVLDADGALVCVEYQAVFGGSFHQSVEVCVVCRQIVSKYYYIVGNVDDAIICLSMWSRCSWNTSCDRFRPKGSRLKRYRPWWVLNVVSRLAASSSSMAKQPDLASSLEKNFAPHRKWPDFLRAYVRLHTHGVGSWTLVYSRYDVRSTHAVKLICYLVSYMYWDAPRCVDNGWYGRVDSYAELAGKFTQDFKTVGVQGQEVIQ